MAIEDPEVADIATIAMQFHALGTEGVSFRAGGPVRPGALDIVADAVTEAYSVRPVLDALARSDDPVRTLREWSKVMWTVGFNTGAMYAEKHCNDGG